MKRLRHAAVRLYPRAWRERYGEEFAALLDDRPPCWRDVVDITTGALVMHMSRLTLVPVAFACAGGLVGTALSFTTAPVYASSSLVHVQMPASSAATSQGDPIRAAIEAALSETAFDRQAIAVTVRDADDRSPTLLEVTGSGNSAQAAKQTAERAAGSLIAANLTAAERTPEHAGVQFRIVEAATLPGSPQRDTARYATVGALFGAVAGAIVALAKRRQRLAR